MTKNGESVSNGESAVKQKTSFFSVQGKSAWYFFMVFLFVCFMSPVSADKIVRW